MAHALGRGYSSERANGVCGPTESGRTDDGSVPGIRESRKTGYKFEQRYEEHGSKGLYDVSRRPKRLARQISAGVQTAILELKREKPTWGAFKIQERLRRTHPEMEVPVRSTIHDLLDRYGL